MTFQPAHKVTTSMNKPGQIVNPLMFPNQLKHEAEQAVKGKLSFVQWYEMYFGVSLKNATSLTQFMNFEECWNAAQQNA